MLLPSLLTLTFAYGSSVDSSDEEAPRDTAQQAQNTPTKKPAIGAMSTTEGHWDEVISLLRQVQGVEPLRVPVCHAAQDNVHWVEIYTRSGEWRAATRPQATLAATVASAPPLAELKGLQPQHFVPCDVVKPWVESAYAPRESLLFMTQDALMVSIQPVAGGR